MDYAGFLTVCDRALSTAGLLRSPTWPTETVDLRSMDRHYSVLVPGRNTGPFYPTLGLRWPWDALHAARTATTEEHLLTELLGEDGYMLVTERPWLRVDLTLCATLPAYALIPLPDPEVWRHWAGRVARQLAPLLPTEVADEEAEELPLSWRGALVARLKCGADGQLYLTGVELPAWEGIELARQWDSPDRPRDQGTEAQLAGLFGRLVKALGQWEAGLRYLV